MESGFTSTRYRITHFLSPRGRLESIANGISFFYASVVMSTVSEIEAAIETLPEDDRQRLESWFIAQRFGDDAALERELTVAIQASRKNPRRRASVDSPMGFGKRLLAELSEDRK